MRHQWTHQWIFLLFVFGSGTAYQGRNSGLNFGELKEGGYHQESLASIKDQSLMVFGKKEKIRMVEESTRTEKLKSYLFSKLYSHCHICSLRIYVVHIHSEDSMINFFMGFSMMPKEWYQGASQKLFNLHSTSDMKRWCNSLFYRC